MYFSDFNGVVGKEIVPFELEVTAFGVESKNFSIVIQELFLRWYTATSELLFEEFEELWVLLWRNWLL